jgi:xylobiose transport system substrate-binding protein
MLNALRRGSSRRPRILAATGACALAATTLAACGSSGPGAGGDALEVWVYQDGSTVIQEEFVERFNEESDIDINLTQIPGENYQDRMRTAMGGDNAPDIFFNWGGGSIGDFVAEDMLVDLTDTLASEPEFQDAFIPSILDAGAIDGRHYGVPMRGVQPVILFYNQTLFDDAGLEAPETYDDLLNAIDTFQQQDLQPIALGGADPWTELMWLEYLLDRQGGADVFETIRNGDSSGWGDPAVLDAAERAADLADMGAFGNNYRSVGFTNDAISTFFGNGDAAMHLMGSWEYSAQLTLNPEFAENDLAYTAFPTIEGGAGDASAVVGNPTNYWSVHSSLEAEGEEDRLDAAIEFLKLMATEDYAQALIDNGDVPTTTNAQELLDSSPNPEFAQWQYDMVANASDFTLSWDQAVPAQQSDPLVDSIEQLFAEQLTPQEFVDELQNL